MKDKIVWIDVLRVLAMFLVVIGHGLYTSGHTYFGSYEFANENEIYNLPYRFFSILVSFIYSFHMPLFMAVSGACFAITFGRKPMREVIKSKVKRLLVPFFWTALCLSIPVRIILGYYDASGNNPVYILAHHFIFPFQIHLWFLLSLFLIFILFYLLKPLHDKYKYLFWPLLILLSYAGNILESPLHAVLGIPEALKNMFYFAVGFYSINYFINKTPRWYTLSISLLLQFAAFIIWARYIEPLGHSYYFCIILALWGSYNTTALCILLAKWEYLINSKIYQLILKYNFQIYLYSDSFNYLFLMAIFSLSFIDFFGNPIHTFTATVLRIFLGIGFGILVAKFIEKLPARIKFKQLSK